MIDSRERDVVQAFVDLSFELVQDYDLVELLDQLTATCARLLDVASAGLLLADERGTLHLAASSSERTHDLEMLQLQRDDGPCLDCFRSDTPVLVPDLRAEQERWPQFVPAALRVGLLSVHALPMVLRGSTLGALGLFGEHTGRLNDDDLALAQALVHVAGVAIVNEKSAADRETVNAQLQHALSSRIILEQAKGVLAHAGTLDMAAAFDVLRGYARHRGRRLSLVASQVVDGSLPASELLAHARATGRPQPRP